MKVLFTTLREKSHFSGLLPFIEACLRGGHSVGVAAPPDFAERVAATGARFFPVGHPGDEGLRPHWARLRGATAEEASRIAIGDLFAGVCAEAAIPSVLELIADWGPSIVLRESFEWAGFVAAEKLGVAQARIAICAPGSEATIETLAMPAVDAHRRRLGMPEDPTGERVRAEPALTLFPRSFDPSGDASAQLFRFRAVRKSHPPLPEWWGAQQGPFVYVTLGTVAGKLDVNFRAFRVALDAVAGLPIRVLLTTGSDLPLEELGDVPANVHVERFVPQDDVIPHATAVLCHAGSGTVLGVLAAGIPMVAAPLFADQPHNAQCVATTGAGLAVPIADNAAELRSALTRVLDEASFRTRARVIADEIAELPLIDEAARVVERLAAK